MQTFENGKNDLNLIQHADIQKRKIGHLNLTQNLEFQSGKIGI